MEIVKILIADDHKIIRDGISSLLKGNKQFRIVANAENGLQVLKILETVAIDLIIMDISMPEMNGIEATKKVKKLFPDVLILILSMYNEEQYVREVFNSGASGYILKNSGKRELINAITNIFNGKPHFSPEITQAYIQSINKPEVKEIKLAESLSAREIEVLQLMVDEYANQEIADKLFISIRTVDAHRRNLINKTGVKSTAGLIKYAIVNKIVE
jgi:DNA-binding NarL/FixJ family response regulator